MISKLYEFTSICLGIRIPGYLLPNLKKTVDGKKFLNDEEISAETEIHFEASNCVLNFV